MDKTRLIERAFCLKQASIDSVQEKTGPQGHISTLHTWPARRPLAACRAALVATLLADPDSKEGRERILERIGGKLVPTIKRKKLPGGNISEKEAEETVGGILRWGRESGPEVAWFRDEIRKTYADRAPRVLDPFAGGGAIPLEAMRLGCEVTATDINPVAWFVLKCTLVYPQRLAGQHRPLPAFAATSPEFMESFFKATIKATRQQLARNLQAVQQTLFPPPAVDFAWHVRAWGWWVLQRAKADLQNYYPVIEGKPTVAYLWARTVTCKGCRATIPLLKTRWLCKKDDKRVLLTMQPDLAGKGVLFGTEANVSRVGGNNAQRREHDRKLGSGTMSRSGAQCPCCPVIMTTEDIRLEGKAGRLGAQMTAVVVDGRDGKEYRLPTPDEINQAELAAKELTSVFADIPFGIPNEPLPTAEALGFRVPLYGFDRWHKLFMPRQLLSLGVFVRHTRAAREAMSSLGYPTDWIEAVSCYLAAMLDQLANRSSHIARWNKVGENVKGTFVRFALPIVWDFAEVNPIGDTTGGYASALKWVPLVASHLLRACHGAAPATVICASAQNTDTRQMDIIVTDPPYYDAIPYSDLMDFFYVWLRRTLYGLSAEIDMALREPLCPKWDQNRNDGELIDDASRFDGDKARSKQSYEDGMARSFSACHEALAPDGRLVIVFAHKQPDAWETLVSAIIRAGFLVDGSWPLQTEHATRTRSLSSAALSSSVWLVCRKRDPGARPGWDNRVLEEMRQKIHSRLREYWDAGIQGPDFVWAATGPALEAYSKHPVVKKANDPGQVLTVSQFLREVRRLVVEFAVGRLLSSSNGDEAAGGLDDATLYYLLHRHDFAFDDAPAGAAILYAQACGVTDIALVDSDILVKAGGARVEDDDDDDNEEGAAADAPREGTGSAFRLRRFTDRRSRSLGIESDGRVPPLIDQLHKLMHLWRAGDVNKVNDFIDARALRRSPRFGQLIQSIIEMARKQGESEECALLESISNHLAARGTEPAPQPSLPYRKLSPAEEEVG